MVIFHSFLYVYQRVMGFNHWSLGLTSKRPYKYDQICCFFQGVGQIAWSQQQQNPGRSPCLLSTEPHGSFVEPHRDGIPVGRAGPAVAAGPSGRRDGMEAQSKRVSSSWSSEDSYTPRKRTFCVFCQDIFAMLQERKDMLIQCKCGCRCCSNLYAESKAALAVPKSSVHLICYLGCTKTLGPSSVSPLQTNMSIKVLSVNENSCTHSPHKMAKCQDW